MSARAFVIAERLGQANAERLAVLVGGTSITIPDRLSAASALRARIGDDLAVLVVLHFGGLERIYVPRLAHSGPVDDRAVARLTNRGWSAKRIARKLECSERAIYSARRRNREGGERRNGAATTGRTGL
jgi:Homeodomain-like domain